MAKRINRATWAFSVIMAVVIIGLATHLGWVIARATTPAAPLPACAADGTGPWPCTITTPDGMTVTYGPDGTIVEWITNRGD